MNNYDMWTIMTCKLIISYLYCLHKYADGMVWLLHTPWLQNALLESQGHFSLFRSDSLTSKNVNELFNGSNVQRTKNLWLKVSYRLFQGIECAAHKTTFWECPVHKKPKQNYVQKISTATSVLVWDVRFVGRVDASITIVRNICTACHTTLATN